MLKVSSERNLTLWHFSTFFTPKLSNFTSKSDTYVDQTYYRRKCILLTMWYILLPSWWHLFQRLWGLFLLLVSNFPSTGRWNALQGKSVSNLFMCILSVNWWLMQYQNQNIYILQSLKMSLGRYKKYIYNTRNCFMLLVAQADKSVDTSEHISC